MTEAQGKWQEFDIADFHRRWTKARMTVLHAMITQNSDSQEANGDLKTLSNDSSESEQSLLQKVPTSAQETLLRSVFDASRKFAINTSKYFGVEWELSDLQDILCVSPIPCCNGDWKAKGKALAVSRNGCQSREVAKPMICDYFREALDGLIMGICSEERIARHASVGHGDENCLDVYFIDSSAGTKDGMRMAPVPNEVAMRISEIASKLERQGQKLEFKGYAEGNLFYTLHSDKGPTCGAAGRYFHELVAKEVGRIFPHFRLQDAAPLAVYGEGTK